MGFPLNVDLDSGQVNKHQGFKKISIDPIFVLKSVVKVIIMKCHIVKFSLSGKYDLFEKCRKKLHGFF
jgi:hypothetical protein